MKILFPKDYPNSLPTVFELDGKIDKAYHTNPDLSLCLGTEVELYAVFSKRPCLKTFIEEILNPYLYRWLYITKYNKEPWADRSHGIIGIMEAYSEMLSVPCDKNMICNFISLLMLRNTRANSLCPCNSGKKVKCCHRKKLEKLAGEIPTSVFYKDFLYIKRGNEL